MAISDAEQLCLIRCYGAEKGELMQAGVDSEAFDTLLEQGLEMLRVWLNQYTEDESRVVGVEEVFLLEIPGLPVPVIDAIDLLLEDQQSAITVVDYKTAARKR